MLDFSGIAGAAEQHRFTPVPSCPTPQCLTPYTLVPSCPTPSCSTALVSLYPRGLVVPLHPRALLPYTLVPYCFTPSCPTVLHPTALHLTALLLYTLVRALVEFCPYALHPSVLVHFAPTLTACWNSTSTQHAIHSAPSKKNEPNGRPTLLVHD